MIDWFLTTHAIPLLCGVVPTLPAILLMIAKEDADGDV